MDDKKCIAVGGTHLANGWGCCQCNIYNGDHRTKCKNCKHERCYYPAVVIEATVDVDKSKLN